MIKKESSTTAGIKGFQGGPSAKAQRRTLKVSKPFSEKTENQPFEDAVLRSEVLGKGIPEVVKKRANTWVELDDDTGGELGSYKDRETAWARQRIHRRVKKAQKTSANKKKSTGKSMSKTAKTNKPKKISQIKKEALLRRIFKSALNENMLSYVFEQTPTDEETQWGDKFMQKLSRQSVMADPELRKIVNATMTAEAQLLGKAFRAITKILQDTGSFEVEQGELDQLDQGDVILNFFVAMLEGGKKLRFSVKIENGRPLIMFPEESRASLNSMANDDSKLLRAELMHCQETVLDKMDEVVNATKARDTYFRKLELKVDAFLSDLNPVEIAMMRSLLKNKYNGIK